METKLDVFLAINVDFSSASEQLQLPVTYWGSEVCVFYTGKVLERFLVQDQPTKNQANVLLTSLWLVVKINEHVNGMFELLFIYVC